MKLISNSVIYFSGSVASKLFSLVSLPFLTAVLTPKEYGVIAILLMFGAFASSILSLGLGTSIGELYYNNKYISLRDSVISSGFYVIFITHMVYCFIVLQAGNFLSKVIFDTDAYASVVVMMLVGQAIQNLVFPLQLKIQFEERFKIAAFSMLLSSIITVGITIFCVVTLQKGLRGYGDAMLIGAVFQLLVYMVFSQINIFTKKPSIGRELIRKGWPMILSFFFLFIIQYGVRLPIEWYGGLDQLGLFLIGVSLAAPIGMVATAFINAWTPYALSYSDKPENASAPLALATRLYIIAMGIVVILIFLFSPLIVKILAAEQYYESYKIIGLSALWHYFSSIFLLLLPPVYFACDVSRAVVRVQAFAVLAFLVFSIPMIMHSPLIGAAGAVAFAGLILVFAQLFWNKCLKRTCYTQIAYGRSTIVLMLVIPLGCLLVLMADVLLGAFWLSLLIGVFLAATLVKILIAMPQVRKAAGALLTKLSTVS